MIEGKNIAAYNDQPLDSFHDIVVSFDYALFNRGLSPTGGFCVAFFDSINSMPREGGPDYSLGYTPSTKQDKCKQRGYRGLRSAFLGIGFDPYGRFALETSSVDGLESPFLNSAAVRLGKKFNYKLNSYTFNLKSYSPKLENFEIGQFLPVNGNPVFRSVRIILSNAATRLRIQLKDNPDDLEYITVLDTKIPQLPQSAIKVALTNTTLEENTQFLIKNFNVSGSTSAVSDRTLAECTQDLLIGRTMNLGYDQRLASGREWVTVPTENIITIATTDSLNYEIDQTVFSSLQVRILGEDGTNIVTTTPYSSSVQIYQYLGSKFIKAKTVNLPSGYVSCADIDKTTLVAVGSAPNGMNNVYIYKYINSTRNLSSYGDWELYQTFNYRQLLSGRYLGVSCQINGDNLLIGNRDEYVHAFNFRSDKGWVFLENIYSPLTGKSLFGYTMSLEGKDLVIGAPIARKAKFPVFGGGEVIHYYNGSGSKWDQVMQIGNFYNLDVAAGEFGSALKLKNNILVVGTPYQLWEPADPSGPLTYNVGRSYVFRKTTDGIFSQGTTLVPLTSQITNNLQYGKGVSINGNTVVIAAPNFNQPTNNFISFYNVDCLFNFTIPAPLGIPPNAYITVDLTAFILSYQEGTYMISLQP
jgi:hypothetical protein